MTNILTLPYTCSELTGRAAAIWSSADIVHIAIYRDMSKISRYVSRYIFMVIKVMKLMIIGDIKVFIAIHFK